MAPTLCHSPALPAPDWPQGQARSRWESAYSVPCKSAEPCASSSWLCPHLRPERQLRAYRWGIWRVTGGTAKWWGWAAGTLPGPQPHSCSCQDGGWEQLQQQAEASVRVGEGRGSPHRPGNQPRGESQQCVWPWASEG